MPLPKPPSPKAAILSQADFESQAAPRADRKGAKSRSEPMAGPSLDLYDGGAPVAAPQLPARQAGRAAPAYPDVLLKHACEVVEGASRRGDTAEAQVEIGYSILRGAPTPD